MKKIYTYILAFAAMLGCTSCNDWLDVKGETESKEEDLFQKESGFYNALTGCYMAMADRTIYGEGLTMSYIESLAALWDVPNESNNPVNYNLRIHNYTQENDVKPVIKAIYNKLFNVITQANMLLKNLEQNGDVIADPAVRAVIEGEALAMRAYCQFDVLRLFGQIPQNATIEVMLPYSESCSIDVIPPYYNFADYVQKIENDLDRAEELLKENDPVMEYTFDKLDSPTSLPNLNSFLLYRQFRFNYWAVRGIKARICQYLGRTDDAHSIAMEIINAKDTEGKPLRPLSAVKDFEKEYFACPSECLLAMSKYNLLDYTIDLLFGGSDTQFRDGEDGLAIKKNLFDRDLFKGQNIVSHNRYLQVWNTRVQTNQAEKYCAVKKYFYNEKKADLVNLQLIPLLRTSELYLIAMECSKDLNEVNQLYRTYMLDRNVLIDGDHFSSLMEVQPEIIDEYRREFIGEGLMFYVYKRTNAPKMLWLRDAMQEELYILPLPDTEYNPN